MDLGSHPSYYLPTINVWEVSTEPWSKSAFNEGSASPDKYLTLGSALRHLGRSEEAKAVLDDLEEYRGIGLSEITLCPWWQLYQDTGPNEPLFEGLRKAGLPE